MWHWKKINKKTLKEGLKRVTDLYNRGISRIKNNRIKNALNSNLANTALNYGNIFAVYRLNRYLLKMNGILNFEIAKVMKGSADECL